MINKKIVKLMKGSKNKLESKLPSRHFDKESFNKMEYQLKLDTIDNYLILKNIGGI
jgi:hypothetical protein